MFLLPTSLCKQLNKLMSNFWWGHMQKEKMYHRMCWDKLGQPKNRGGLGFRDVEVFNLALLAKQGWRLIQQPDSLVAKVLKEKYFPSCEFLQASVGRNPSCAWCSIFKAREVLGGCSGGWVMERR
jgi:hypothetical protein